MRAAVASGFLSLLAVFVVVVPALGSRHLINSGPSREVSNAAAETPQKKSHSVVSGWAPQAGVANYLVPKTLVPDDVAHAKEVKGILETPEAPVHHLISGWAPRAGVANYLKPMALVPDDHQEDNNDVPVQHLISGWAPRSATAMYASRRAGAAQQLRAAQGVAATGTTRAAASSQRAEAGAKKVRDPKVDKTLAVMPFMCSMVAGAGLLLWFRMKEAEEVRDGKTAPSDEDNDRLLYKTVGWFLAGIGAIGTLVSIALS